jgi:exopolysaccharide biosynthesis WecB/TagA/CpsF family protein
LESLVQRFGVDNVRLVIYWTYPVLIKKTEKYLQDKWYQVVYAQDGYSNLDRDQVERVLPPEDGKINVLLVARSTPVYPIQEIWTYANKHHIKKYGFLVMNQAGTFDRWVWEQKRPPMIVRHLRLEWLWRLISDPKRNYKKVLDSLWILHYIFSHLLLKKRAR